MSSPALSADEIGRLAEMSPDPMMVLDEMSNIAWANRAAAVLLAGDDGTVVGENALDFLHPEDVEQALAAHMARTELMGRGLAAAVLAPASYRVRRADGTHVWFELAGRVDPTLAGGSVVIVAMRSIDRHQRLLGAIELVVQGAPLLEIAPELLYSIDHDQPRRLSGMSWEADGERIIASSTLPSTLVWSEDPSDPWSRAVSENTVHSVPTAELRDELRLEAERLGLAVCVTAAVPDPSAEHPACLVQWADEVSAAWVLEVRLRGTATSLLTLALRERHERAALVRAATRDALTGLVNRAHLVERLEAATSARMAIGLLFCDLDGFKPVNDRHGHDAGDAVLRTVAHRLVAAVRDHDIVSRIGGDEFAILVTEITDSAELVAMGERICAAIAAPIRVVIDARSMMVDVGISVGAVASEAGSEGIAGSLSPDTMLHGADAAMYEAKRAGGGRCHLGSLEPS